MGQLHIIRTLPCRRGPGDRPERYAEWQYGSTAFPTAQMPLNAIHAGLSVTPVRALMCWGTPFSFFELGTFLFS